MDADKSADTLSLTDNAGSKGQSGRSGSVGEIRQTDPTADGSSEVQVQ